MNYLKSALYSVLTTMTLFIAALFFLLATTPGLYILVNLVGLSLPGHLSLQQAEGSLIKGMSFKELRYSDARLNVHIIRANVVWKMTFNPWHQTLRLNQVHVGQLVLGRGVPLPDGRGSETKPFMPFDLQINELMMDELSMATFNISQLQLTAAMDNFSWSIKSLKAQYDHQNLTVQAAGQLQNNYDVSATVDIHPVSNGVSGHLNIKGDTTCYRWSGKFSGQYPVTLDGSLNHLKQLNSTLSLGENRVNVTGRIPEQLQIKVVIPQPQLFHPALAQLKTTITANAVMNGLQQGTLSMMISPGIFQPAANSALPPIPFQGGRVSMTLAPQGLLATSEFIFNPNETLKASVRLPEFNWHRASSLSQSIDGTANLRVVSLDFLNGVSPTIKNLHGQLSADLILKGSLDKPDVQGKLTLSDAGLSFPEAGVSLNPIQASLMTHNQHWDLTGSIVGEDGHVLDINGRGDVLPQFRGEVMMHAENFSVLKTPEYAINVSPQLTLKLDQDVVEISGVVQVPWARFKPMVFSNTQSLTEDAVFVSHEAVSTPSLMHVKGDVRVKVGQDVIVDAQGLHGVLGGEIQLIQPLNGALSAVGELTIRDGTYKAYGQNLAINHGQLLFAGATPSNPKISLRAVRSFNNTAQFSGSNQLFDFNASNLQTIDFGNHVTVGIDVGGYLNDPKIKLFSIPSSLSQSDILSLLLLGKPASQASQSGGQLLLTAISAMNLGSGAKGMQLLSQVKQTLGLDFDVQSSSMNNPTTNKTVGDTAFVVGKALSKRLYLSYSIGILQENSNVLILKYLLNKYFSVQVTASTIENGVDLLYTHAA